MIEPIHELMRLIDKYNQIAEQPIEYKTEEPMSRHTSFRVR